MDLGGITPVEAIAAMPENKPWEDEVEEETSVPPTAEERLRRAKEFLLLLEETGTELEIIKEEDFWRDSDSTMSSESGVISDSDDGTSVGKQNTLTKPPQRRSEDQVDTDSSDEVEPLNRPRKPSRSKKKRPSGTVNNEDTKGESSDEVEPLYSDEGVPLSPSSKPKKTKKPTPDKTQDSRPTDSIPTDPTSFYEKLSALPQDEAPGTAEGASSPDDNRSQAESGIGHEPNGERPLSPLPDDDEEVEPEDDYVPPKDDPAPIPPPRAKKPVESSPKPEQKDDTAPPNTSPSQPSNGSKGRNKPSSGKKSNTTPVPAPEDDGFFGNLLKSKKGHDQKKPGTAANDPKTAAKTEDEKPGLLDNLLNKLKPKTTDPDENARKDDSKEKLPVEKESSRKPGTTDLDSKTRDDTAPKNEVNNDDKPGLFDNVLNKLKPKARDPEDIPSKEDNSGKKPVEKDSSTNQKTPGTTDIKPETEVDKDEKPGLLHSLLNKLKPKDPEDNPSKEDSKPTDSEAHPDQTKSSDRQPDKTADKSPNTEEKPSEGVLGRVLKKLIPDKDKMPEDQPTDQSTNRSDEPSQGQKPKTALPAKMPGIEDEPPPIPPPRTKSPRRRPTTLPLKKTTEKDNKEKDDKGKTASKKLDEKTTSNNKKNGPSKPKNSSAPRNPMLVFGIVPMEFEDATMTPPRPRKKKKPDDDKNDGNVLNSQEESDTLGSFLDYVFGRPKDRKTPVARPKYAPKPNDGTKPKDNSPKTTPSDTIPTKKEEPSPAVKSLQGLLDRTEPAKKTDQPIDEPAEKTDQPKDEPAKKTDQPKDEPAKKTDQPKDEPAKKTDQPKDEPAKKTDQPKDEPAKATEQPKSEPVSAKPAKVTEQPKDEPTPSKPAKEPEQPKDEPATAKPPKDTGKAIKKELPEQIPPEVRPTVEKPSEDKAAPPSPKPKSTKEKKAPKTPSPKVRKSSKTKEPTDDATKKKAKDKKPAKDKTSKSRKKSEDKPVNAEPPPAKEPLVQLENVEPVKAKPPAPQIPDTTKEKIEDEPVFAAPPQAKENLPTSPRSRKPSKSLLSKLKKLKDGLTHDISSDNEVESPETKRKAPKKAPDTTQEKAEPEKVEPPPRRKREDRSMSPPPQKREEKAPDTTQEEPEEIPMKIPTPPRRHKKDEKENEEPVKAESPPPQKEEEKEPDTVQEQEPVKAAPPPSQEKEEPPKPEEKEDVKPVAVTPAAPQPEEKIIEQEPVEAAPPKPQEKEEEEPPTPKEEDVTPVTVEPVTPQPEEAKKEPERIEPEPVAPMPSQPQEKQEPSTPDKTEDSKPETIEESVPQKEETTEEEKEPDTTEARVDDKPVETEPEKPKEEDNEKVTATVEETPTEDEEKDEPKLEDQPTSEPTESVPTEMAPPLPPRRTKSKKEPAPTDADEPIIPEEQPTEESDGKVEPPPLPVKKKSQRSEDIEQLSSPVDEHKYPEINFSDEPPPQTNLDDIFHSPDDDLNAPESFKSRPPLQTNLDDLFSSPDDVLNAPCKGSDDDVVEEEGIVPDELAPVKVKKRSDSFKAGRDRLKALGKSLKDKATRRKTPKTPDEEKPEMTDDPEDIDKEVDTPSSPQEPDAPHPKNQLKSLLSKATRRKSPKSPDEEKPEITDEPENIDKDVDTPSSPQESDAPHPKNQLKSFLSKATRRKPPKTPDEEKPEITDEPENIDKDVDTPSSPQEPNAPLPKKPSKSLLSKLQDLKDGLLSDSEKELTPHVQKKQNDEEPDEPVISKAADQEDMATPGPSHDNEEKNDSQKEEAPTKPEKKKIHFPRNLSKLRNSFKKRIKSKSDDGPKSDLKEEATPAQEDENKDETPTFGETPKGEEGVPDSPSFLTSPTSPDESFSTVIENLAAKEDPEQEPFSKPLDTEEPDEDQVPDEVWSPWFKDTEKTPQQDPSDTFSSPILDKKPEDDVPSPLMADPDAYSEVRPKLPPKLTDPEEPFYEKDKEEVPIWEKIKPLEETCVKCHKVLKDSDVVVNFNGLILHQTCMSAKEKDKKEESQQAPKDDTPPKPDIEDISDDTPKKPPKDDDAIFNTCWVCGEEITGMMIVALGRYWHAEHFRCARCGIPFKTVGLPHYEHGGKAYCEPHFHELFSDFCYACDQPITDEIICAMNKTWCRKHFSCAMCNQSIKLDEKFYACDNRPVCKRCKDKVPASLLQTRKKRTIIDTIKDMVRSPRSPTAPTLPTTPNSPPENPNEYFV